MSVVSGEALRVGIDESPPPPLCFGRPGTPEFRGFEVDLLTSLGERLGLALRAESLGWESSLERLGDGSLELLCRGVTITPARRRVVSFSDPYLETSLALVVSRDSRIQSADDLIALNVGVRRATQAEAFVQDHCPAATPRTFQTNAASYAALSDGHVAAVIDHEPIARYFARTDTRLQVRTGWKGVALQYGLVLARENEQLRRTVNEALAGLRADGTWERHCRQWL